MTSRQRYQRVKEVYQQAVELEPQERADFLERHCGGDAELMAEVRSLLEQEATPTEALVDAVAEAARAEVDVQAMVGSTVGPYQILELIGEGGFAVVFLAEQQQPVRRRVALKVIKLGMDTRPVLARFEAERQALALMNHPNVAWVFDAGSTPTGRPYFAMEYVPGVSITEHCDRQRLSVKERLKLFMQVCEAVQHAHQKGIIHRDLKPSNVLVSAKEGSALVKVIDFGVAKAIAHRLAERTVYTEMGQLIGTPEYMSPEQAEMSGQDIDTRSDIYSLGVLLYELLTGALPFDPATLRRAGIAEIQRIIREQEPAKPSTRLSSLGDDSGLVATKRRTDSRSLVRELRGDLDWITMRALEKDRERRYRSATELSDDTLRYLNDEPIEARPPSATYRLRRFIKRNRTLVSAATAVFVALTVGIIATAAALLQAIQAQQLARSAADMATFQLQAARREVAAAQLQIESLAPQARQAEDLAYLMPLDLQGDFPREVLDDADEWIENLLPGARFCFEHFDSFLFDPADHFRNAVMYQWIRANRDRIQELIEATRRYRLEFSAGYPSPSPLLTAFKGGGEAPSYWYAPAALCGNAAGLHLDGEWEGAIESLRAARRLARSVGASPSGHGIANEHPVRAWIMATYRWMIVDATARGECPDAYHDFIAADPPIASLDMYVTFWARAVRQIVNESFVKDDALARSADYEKTIDLVNWYFERLRLHQDASFAELAELDDSMNRTVGKNPVVERAISRLESTRSPVWFLQKRHQMQMDRDGSILSAAICAYRCTHSDWPRSLAEALDDYGLQPTRRSYFGRDFIYRVEHDWPVLYCVGADAKDDGGTLELDVLFLTSGRAVAGLLQGGPSYGASVRLQGVPSYGDCVRGAELLRQNYYPVAEDHLRVCLDCLQRELSEDNWLTAQANTLLGSALAGQGRLEEGEALLLEGYATMITLRTWAAVSGSTLTPEVYRRDVVERLVALYDAWGKPEKAAEWRAKLTNQD